MLLLGSWCLTVFCCFVQVLAQNGCDHPCQTGGICNATKISNSCYYIFHSTKKTWSDTRLYCKSLNLTMVKLPKEVMKNKSLLQNLVEGIHPSPLVWLGGKAEDFSEWTFINGVPLNGTHWDWNFRNRGDLDRCGAVSLISGSGLTTSTKSCWQKTSFICRFDDWKERPSLYLIETRASWSEARSRCVSLGGDLLYTNRGEDVKDDLKVKLQPHKNQQFWVGLTHKLWKWDGGEQILYFNWRNERMNYNEKCLAMYSNGLWENHLCTGKSVPFCQGGTSANERETQTSADVPKATDDYTGSSNCGDVSHGILLALIALVMASMTFWIIRLKKKLQDKGSPRNYAAEDEHNYDYIDMRAFNQASPNGDETGAADSTSRNSETCQEPSMRKTPEKDSKSDAVDWDGNIVPRNGTHGSEVIHATTEPDHTRKESNPDTVVMMNDYDHKETEPQENEETEKKNTDITNTNEEGYLSHLCAAEPICNTQDNSYLEPCCILTQSATHQPEDGSAIEVENEYVSVEARELHANKDDEVPEHTYSPLHFKKRQKKKKAKRGSGSFQWCL